MGNCGKKTKRGGRKRVGFNATIVVATISCGIARNGKKLKKSFAPPREKISPAPFAHTNGSPGWNLGPLESREGGGEGSPSR